MFISKSFSTKTTFGDFGHKNMVDLAGHCLSFAMDILWFIGHDVYVDVSRTG
jgi:hypothetical protein